MKSLAVLFGVLFFILTGSSVVFSQQEFSDLNIYDTVDKMPRLKGASNDLSQYVRKKVDYSDEYKIRGVEGDIWLSFVVTSLGTVTDVEIEKGIDKDLDEQVKEIVSNTSRWKPGQVNKKKVNTRMHLPVRFTLTTSERQFAQQIMSLNESGKMPLFVLDNKLVDGVVKIESYNLESVRVIKGSKAIKLYGERAENGVVIITSKIGTPPLYY